MTNTRMNKKKKVTPVKQVKAKGKTTPAKKTVAKKKVNELTTAQKEYLTSLIDTDTTLESQDKGIVEAMQKTTINKDLVISFLVEYARDIERALYSK